MPEHSFNQRKYNLFHVILQKRQSITETNEFKLRCVTPQLTTMRIINIPKTRQEAISDHTWSKSFMKVVKLRLSWVSVILECHKQLFVYNFFNLHAKLRDLFKLFD